MKNIRETFKEEHKFEVYDKQNIIIGPKIR